jgi:hypothetical protein
VGKSRLSTPKVLLQFLVWVGGVIKAQQSQNMFAILYTHEIKKTKKIFKKKHSKTETDKNARLFLKLMKKHSR